ncbi:AsmA family protein [Henriciella algicola]|uniref:AsmA family protein n=1 Tax=Henriciella algicola TaxID=1608422 RepID=A0A399RI06_9PROT|nr:AsmA-like C-terminal region-containing protein [Henriciella algicola]RIJ31290.1 AsmA family protein [Henriciella algicola]
MTSGLKRSFKIAGWVIGIVLLAFLLFLLAMTQPRFGTPVANALLGAFGPDGSRVGTAHTRFPAVLVVEGEGLVVPGRVSAERIEAQVNLFGFLPFVSWLSYLEAENGSVRIEDSGESDGDGPGLKSARRIVDKVSLTSVTMQVVRPDETRDVEIETARGSLRSGAFMLEARGAGSRLSFDGRTSDAFSELDGGLRLRGENFADVADLVGLAAPDTPPYDMRLTVDIGPERWTLNVDPETRIGDSDLYGEINVMPGGEVPVVNAELTSAALDADDLAIVFGIPIGVGEGETSGTRAKAARAAFEQSGRLIPDVEIDFARLDAVDGSVSYTAETVTDSLFDIEGLGLDVEIEGRLVRAPRIHLDFAQGEFRGYATLDGTQSPAHTDARGELSNVAFDNLSLSPYLRGGADGEFEVTTDGNGFRDAAATMNGTVSIWSTDADILALAAEGAALDFGEAITLLGEAPGDRTYVDARCAAIVANFENGVGTLSPAVVDTDDSLVVVRGDVNLSNEALRLSVRSEAKDASLGTLIGDVAIGGTLRDPSIQPFSAGTVAQFGIAGILASVSGGLAALPFIEPGMAQDAPCGELLARAQSASAEAE